VSPHILVFWRPDMRLYSAYMLKPVSTDVPASDAYMTLLPNYKGKTNMATLFRVIQEDIFDEQLMYVGVQVRSRWRVCGKSNEVFLVCVVRGGRVVEGGGGTAGVAAAVVVAPWLESGVRTQLPALPQHLTASQHARSRTPPHT
jgi:hypothetical protein